MRAVSSEYTFYISHGQVYYSCRLWVI